MTRGLEKSRDARCASRPMLPASAVRATALPLRRCATIGGVALVVSVGGIAAAAALFGSRPPRMAGSAGELGLVRAARPAGELGAPGLAGAAQPAGELRAAAAKPVLAPLASDPAGAQRQTLALCGELLEHQQWQALDVCAGELAGLGATARAEQFHVTARQALQRDTVRQALRAGRLADARLPIAPLGAATPGAAGLRGRVAAAERERAPDVPRPTEALAATARPASGRRRSCRTLDVQDVMTRAAIQYDRGAATVALALTRSALACKQTDRMYWLAVLYACAAHDAAAAKQYFAKVPANLQSGIERKCQQDSIDVRSR